MAETLDLWRSANPYRVSPFFTTTRAVDEVRGLAATVLGFGLAVVFATVAVFGFVLTEVVVVRGLMDVLLAEGLRLAT